MSVDDKLLTYPQGQESQSGLGPCCICGGSRLVRYIIQLEKKSPYAKGWGCLQCGLPPEGATAVICDRCACTWETTPNADIEEMLVYFCCPEADGSYVRGRAPISELADQPEHKCDPAKHPEWLSDD